MLPGISITHGERSLTMLRGHAARGGHVKRNQYRPDFEPCEGRCPTTGGIAAHAAVAVPAVVRAAPLQARSAPLRAVIAFRNDTRETIAFQFRFTTLNSFATY